MLPTRSPSKRTRSSSTARRAHPPPLPSPTQEAPRAAATTSPSSAGRRRGSAPLVQLTIDPQPLLSKQDLHTFDPRESIASIKDDPFFRNYQNPQSQALARELRSATNSALHDEDSDDSPHGTRTRVTKRPSVSETPMNLPPQSRSGMADINIAIIGSAGVGKSTLIQRALGLRGLPTSIASSLRMSVENVVYTVSLIELDLESFDIHPDRRIQWPKQINGHIVPRMDGALLLYDVMNRDSIQDLPQTLNALVNSLLPTILVSCKCDNPENTRQIDVDSMEAACMSCVEALKAASTVPESARLCLSSVLRAIMANRNANPIEASGPRRRATSSTHLEKTAEQARPPSQQSKHSRASSEFSLLRGFPAPPPSRGPSSGRPTGRTNLHHQLTLPDPLDAPPLSSHPAFRHDNSQDPADATNLLAPPRARSPFPTAKGADNSFLDMEESDAESSYRYSDDIPILQRGDDSFFDKPAKVAGVTFDELVDRLLGQVMSRADSNFLDIFLCLYRKFASPGELFSAILTRLQSMSEDQNVHYLSRTANQLRVVTVVTKWVTCYPGDFASPGTSARLEDFINRLIEDPVFAAAAQDMRSQLRNRVVVDDDTGWARTDADVAQEARETAVAIPASPERRRAEPSAEMEKDMNKLRMDDDDNNGLELRESNTDSQAPRPGTPAHSIAPSFQTVEDYEKEAMTMIPRGTLPLTKFRYHIFMEISDDDLADEMTRIDWVMFSSIRMRDLVRHVSLSLEQKAKCKSLASVNRMVDHFNHIAKWVANMILMRDKAKHRALMLEKFMTIALKLRLLNNYNGLAAVLAGINGSAIHRLAQTRALVPAEVQKRFARLVLLMGTQKSHFAYRLAWENSPVPRIPFIPLHRRDLVSAEEGSRTFVGANGERINWKKFEVLSEVILPIMKSQVMPYPNLNTEVIARELILDCLMPGDDEELYQRSLQVESTSAGPMDFSKKKFPWFQK